MHPKTTKTMMMARGKRQRQLCMLNLITISYAFRWCLVVVVVLLFLSWTRLIFNREATMMAYFLLRVFFKPSFTGRNQISPFPSYFCIFDNCNASSIQMLSLISSCFFAATSLCCTWSNASLMERVKLEFKLEPVVQTMHFLLFNYLSFPHQVSVFLLQYTITRSKSFVCNTTTTLHCCERNWLEAN